MFKNVLYIISFKKKVLYCHICIFAIIKNVTISKLIFNNAPLATIFLLIQKIQERERENKEEEEIAKGVSLETIAKDV
jgi:hypothetical protein